METQQNPWASRLAKVCVLVTFILILAGSTVTTAGAGMASPTAPHVYGQLVFHGDAKRSFAATLEHNHRYIAMFGGACVGALAAMLWRSWAAFAVSIVLMGAGGYIGRLFGVENMTVLAQIRVWPAMALFVGWVLVRARNRAEKPDFEQKLVLFAFVAACIQAAIGTLRVELETAGQIALATNLRISHGIFAQVFLVVLVMLAARLSPVWREIFERSTPQAPKLRRMGITLLGLYFAQLACAAYIRHHGIGMLIPTWPAAGPDGSLLPSQWSHMVGIHFLHTRILPLLITGHVIGLAIATARRAAGFARLTRLSWGLLALVGVQFLLGVMVIWKVRQSHITNTHVVVGALNCATTPLYIARAGRLRDAHA